MNDDQITQPAPIKSESAQESQDKKVENTVQQPEAVSANGSDEPKEVATPAEESSESTSNVADANSAAAKDAAKAKAAAASESPDAKWYIVHTYSGHENKIAKGLRQRSETMGFEDKIFDIIVPTREITKVSQGKKQQVHEKIFPGYVLVKMILTDESWLLVRTTQGVTAFIGAGNKPTPISEKEVDAIKKFMKLEEPLYKAAFTVNEAVKIVDGPFADFLGTIESIDEAKGKVRVLVSIFGRETPVELDFLQVAKL